MPAQYRCGVCDTPAATNEAGWVVAACTCGGPIIAEAASTLHGQGGVH